MKATRQMGIADSRLVQQRRYPRRDGRNQDAMFLLDGGLIERRVTSRWNPRRMHSAEERPI